MTSILLSALSGCLLGLAFCVPALSFLVWVCLAPFFYVIKKSPFGLGLLCSGLFAFCYYGVAMFWVNHVTIPGYIALMFYLCLYGLVFFLASRYFFTRPFSMLTVSCVWVCVELLKEYLWPQCNWAHLGYSQFRFLRLIQVADIGGVKLISWLIAMVNVFILEAVFYARTKPKSSRPKTLFLAKAGVIAVLLFSCFTYSFFRLRQLTASSEIKVSIVQPDIPEHFKYQPVEGSVLVESLRYLGSQAAAGSLTVYPEAAWPFIIESGFELKSLIEATKNDTLVGAVEAADAHYYNSALFFAKDGSLLDTYRKIRLVPYGEYIPLRKFLGFIDVINSIGDMSAGKQLVFFDYQGKKFSVLICFEDIFTGLVRQDAQASDFLINITNDAWFYGEPQASQHFAIMTFRAIENRISIIRSANTGISGWVSFTGAPQFMTRGHSRVFFPATETFTVALNKQRSFYTRCGEFFSFACLGFVGAFFAAGRLARKRRANP